MKIRKFRAGDMVDSDIDAEEAKLKAAGLAASDAENKKSSGFFGRFREGNIDQKGSEAYNKYGAGYGQKIEAENDRLKAQTQKDTAAAAAAAPAPAPAAKATSSTQRSGREEDGAPAAKATSSTQRSGRKEDRAPASNAAGQSTTPEKGDRGARDTSRFTKTLAPAAGTKSVPNAAGPSTTSNARNAETGNSRGSRAPAPAANTRTGATYKDMEKANARPAANPMSKDPSQQAPAPAGARASTEQKSEDSYADDTTLSFAERRKRAKMRMKKGSTTDARSVNDRIKDLFKAKGGAIRGYASGGSVSSRADGIAQRGKTRGKMC